MISLKAILFLYGISFLLMLSSCASRGGGEGAAPSTKSANQQQVKSGDFFDDDSSKILKRYGAVNTSLDGKKGARASESATPHDLFQKELGKKEYNAPNYDRKVFWGSKEYQRQVYAGNTDGSRFQKGAREGMIAAGEDGVVSRGDGKVYSTNQLAAKAANEASQGKEFGRSDAYTDERRRLFVQPEKRPSGQQQALSVQDVRQMLGR